MTLKTVKVPSEIEPQFIEAEKFITNLFSGFKRTPETGQIFVGDERYVLIRAESLSVKFFDYLMNMYPTMDEHEAISSTSKVLFDMGHSIGKSDAICCFTHRGLTDPIEKLSAGPPHFSHTGWAFVEILEESRPSTDEDFSLYYDHPHTFEADCWIKSNKKTDFCTCHMNAGYSSGWVSESFGFELKSEEILCRSKGDPYCRFVMARPHKLKEKILSYKTENPEIFK